jgi:hypothetical protein
MVALSRKLAQDAGVADKAQFVEADMYEYDISKATVMALFLLPVNMNRLAPKFFNLAPGSRIVANTFGIDGWEPDVRVTLPPASECESWCEALLWIVPAKIAGTWTMANGSMTLTQEYQAVQGTITIGGRAQAVVMGRLKGEELTFVAGGTTYKGIVKGNTIAGSMTTPKGEVPWTANRNSYCDETIIGAWHQPTPLSRLVPGTNQHFHAGRLRRELVADRKILLTALDGRCNSRAISANV